MNIAIKTGLVAFALAGLAFGYSRLNDAPSQAPSPAPIVKRIDTSANPTTIGELKPATGDIQTCSAKIATFPPILPATYMQKPLLICNQAAAILYSPLTRTPLWSAEYLDPDRIARARQQIRTNPFHSDSATGPDGPQLADYVRSGFDRGHMAPNGDMPDQQSQYDSFTLANIVPHNPDNNRRLWAGIEEGVRSYVAGGRTVYVVTGPLFIGEYVESLQHRVAVPTHIWKAFLDPQSGQGGVYVARNTRTTYYSTLSFHQFRQVYGIDPFPLLTEEQKKAEAILPQPESRYRFELEN